MHIGTSRSSTRDWLVIEMLGVNSATVACGEPEYVRYKLLNHRHRTKKRRPVSSD